MPPAARISSTLWEREREHIRTLYLDQDKTLDELMQCMDEEHGFRATRSQYIRRLESWKMKKYSTKEEWEHAVSLVRKRKREGKDSEVIMGGKLIPAKKLKKELGRYGQPKSLDQPDSIPLEEAPDTIIARTPTTESGDTKPIECITIPWFLFCDIFLPIVTSAFEYIQERDPRQFALAMQTTTLAENLLGTDFCVSAAAKTITEMLPKRPGVDALKPQSSLPDHFIQIFCWAVYECSNGLLSDDQTDYFLEWIIKYRNIRFLQHFTRMNDPSTRALMANLLLSAIRLDSQETVRFLLESGTNPRIIHRITRWTALQLSVKGELGNIEIVRLLLKHGACPNTTYPGSTEIHSPLCLAMMDLPRKSSIAEMLILAGADVDIPYLDPKHRRIRIRKTPLIAAAALEDAFLTCLLLEMGANPNVFYPGSRSALHTAVQNNLAGSVKVLLEAGADANIPYGEGNQLDSDYHFDFFSQGSPYDASDSLLTPIDIAYKNGNDQVIALLLQAEAHVDGYLGFVANWDQGISCIALQDAARRGERHLVETLLLAGVDVNSPSDHGDARTALQAAAESGDIDMVQLLLDRGAFVNDPPCGEEGLTALQAAIRSGSRDLIDSLIRQGGNINAQASVYGGQTCLAAAVSMGDIGLVHMLLKKGADINPTRSNQSKSIFPHTILIVPSESTTNFNQDCRETSALAWSITQDDTQLFDLLMSKGAEPDLPQDWPTPLCAAINVGSFNMASRLIAAGADVNRPSRGGDPICGSSAIQTPLQIAIQEGNNQLVNLLIDSHADINYSRDDMRLGAALKTAISSGDRETVELLLSHGADPGSAMSLTSVIPDTGSHVDLEMFRMLINHDVEVNPQPEEMAGFKDSFPPIAANRLHLTPLQAALEGGHEELASMLLEAGADFNAPAFWRWGRTALQAAAMSGSLSFVKDFVCRGANVNAPPARENGATALQFAAIHGHYNIVVFLLENGADVNAPGAVIDGRTALQGAAEHGRLDIVHLLLENDKEGPQSLGQRCQDAAAFAETNGHFIVAETLGTWVEEAPMRRLWRLITSGFIADA